MATTSVCTPLRECANEAAEGLILRWMTRDSMSRDPDLQIPGDKRSQVNETRAP
jgi:hypothetical protein